MYIAHSAITTKQPQPRGKRKSTQSNNRLMLRYRGYQDACNNYAHEIKAIQKWLPDWEPKFPY